VEPRINLDDGATEAESAGNTTRISSITDGDGALKVLYITDAMVQPKFFLAAMVYKYLKMY